MVSYYNIIDLLLVTSWDRFSRNITDSLVMLRRLEKLGIQVQAIEQPIEENEQVPEVPELRVGENFES